jgi:hypothetical protein
MPDINYLKTNAVIWFNKICRSNQLAPKYVNINKKGNNRFKKSQTVVPLYVSNHCTIPHLFKTHIDVPFIAYF